MEPVALIEGFIMKGISRALAGACFKVPRAGISGVAALLGLAALASPMAAMAAPPYSFNIIYLDAQDNIIGQSLAYCNNVQLHAGVVDSKNPYQIVQQGSCNPMQSPTLGIIGFTSATGQTVDYFCNALHTGGTPFYGAPPCNQSIPYEVNQLAPFQPGNGGI
jgi:hypothetical protein